ncbi:MAG TPA: glycine dehydrogenase (aminomethyl-transferring) [Cryomorphaceae bacterium]|nr:glycine dehydrogenase (aminomethyl-transferring) [Cryomorphaceae bacterium]
MKRNSFAYRHIGPKAVDVDQMLSTIRVDSIDTLIDQTVPAAIRAAKDLDLSEAMTEAEFRTHITALGEMNSVFKTYIGMGYHPTVLPGVIQRNILENPGWYTAYTPYQAEIAQGRLEALMNYQTMVVDLTGMELANASLLDEATAVAEAMSMFYGAMPRAKKKAGANKFFVDNNTFPQSIALLKTRTEPIGVELVFGDYKSYEPTEDFFGAMVQYPNAAGSVEDYRAFAAGCNVAGVQLLVAADLLSLTLLTPPGEWGADAVVGTTQRFGIPLGYGGPHAAYFATKESYKRHIPGRIIGRTIDTDGNPALRMALQTREQHIKRDKATSNICTAQVLLAVMAGAYGVYHGPEGLMDIAEAIHLKTATLNVALKGMGLTQSNTYFFDTLKIGLNKTDAATLRALAEDAEINFNYIDAKTVGVSLNETTTDADVAEIIAVFAAAEKVTEITMDELETAVPTDLVRSSAFMTNEVFHSYRSETDMMRYLKYLERKDLALNHSMISLGSCTMKLNAASEMIPLSNASWNGLHPFVPTAQAAGYMQVIEELENDLSEITGFAATSLQPNSGAQGEYAGLMVIRAYHRANGDYHRNIALIPSSAHGTNPASAVMAGMKVVVVGCDEHGNIDVEDLRAKAELHSDNLSSLMITYPSTHGVFESSIKEITSIIHQHGGQVYMDGANMNAQVGLTSPGLIGADVCHLNLHKTFAIPHGGGGPGVGPIGVVEHLKNFLPNSSIISTGGDMGMSISSAPWGSALATTISYAYILMLGADGLKKSTNVAILNANYIKNRLEDKFDILYTGEHNRVGHEMIVDFRSYKEHGIEVLDIAKRLMDYGFHAPTVSFPVANTVMIEPTESESKEELDRFCDALLGIRSEIDEIISNKVDKENNVLKNAPHTLEISLNDNWDFPYSREKAVFPLSHLKQNKFWPTVRRINGALGDRNLICSCPPLTDY